MNFSLLFGLCVINLIHGKYLLVDVDNTQNNPIEPNANRCAWPPCYPPPPPRIDMDDTQNSQIEPKENRCRYPPCRPSAPIKNSPCIPVGDTCVNSRQCCSGTCLIGECIIFARRFAEREEKKLEARLPNPCSPAGGPCL